MRDPETARRRRRTAYELLVVGFGATCFIAGRLGDVSMRDPSAYVVAPVMLAGLLALLWMAP